MLEKYPHKWEDLGLSLCVIDLKFSNLFPTIKKERGQWSLLDYLQNEIIQFNYSSGEKTSEKRELAKQAMEFLLSHRKDDDSKLIEAIGKEKNLDPGILSQFNKAILEYNKNPSKRSPPSRGNKISLSITSQIVMKLHKEDSMITVGGKPDGDGSTGRLRVKRISATEGKPSEVEKYLNLWLEKDITASAYDQDKDTQYIEPVSGSIAHAVYPSGTPKARLLEKESGHLTYYSSINKFQDNLTLAQDITAQPNFNPEAEPGKLLGRPVVGLVGLLITSLALSNIVILFGKFWHYTDGENRFFLRF